MMNQTQSLQGHSAQFAMPLSSYDLTQINLNSAGNVVSSTPNQGPGAANRANTQGGFSGGGKFKVHIEFQPN